MPWQWLPISAWTCGRCRIFPTPPRARLSPPAIKASLRHLVDHWEMRNEDAMALLGGASHGRYFELKKNRNGLLSQDELTRISLLDRHL